MARHIFTFVRGVSAGQRWQPMQESRRRRQPSHHSPPSSNPSEPDPGSYSIPIDPEPQGWLNRTDAARRAFLAEDYEAGMPRGVEAVEPLDPGVGWQTFEGIEWVSLRVGSGKEGWWLVAGAAWFFVWSLALVWMLRH